MTVALNHMIVAARDGRASAEWYAEMFGLEPPVPFSVFWQVTIGDIDFDFDTKGSDQAIPSTHYAFLVSDDEFDTIFARIVERGIGYFADPAGRQRGQINHHDGGRGLYFSDPVGHWLEIITRPYGGKDTG